MDGFHAVSAGVGIVALVIAGLLAVFGNMAFPRLIAGLVLTGSAGILNGTLGPMIHKGATTADHTAGNVLGRLTGVVVVGLVAIVVCGIFAFKMWHKSVDTKTLAIAAAVPALVSLVPGTAGAVFAAVVGVIPYALSWGIRALFGMG